MQHISGISTQLLATKRPHSALMVPPSAKQLLAPAPENIQYAIGAVALFLDRNAIWVEYFNFFLT
jgi:hypothetical protein